MNPRWPIEKILFAVLLPVFVAGGFLRAVFVDFSDFDYGVLSDHFINAVTARNLAQGLGWSSSGYETYLLNPENLTTGPTVVLPVAAAVAWFGNDIRIPGLVPLLLNFALLTGLLFALRRLCGHELFFRVGCLLLSFFLCFKSYYWYRMTGEIPALLCLLLAATQLRLYGQQARCGDWVLAALALTLAQGAKELALLPALVYCAVATGLLARRLDRAAALRSAAAFWCLAFSLPAGFTLYRYLVLATQPLDWQQAYAVYADGLHRYYSGAATLEEYLSHSPLAGLGIFHRIVGGALWNGGTLLHLSFAGLRGIQYWLGLFVAIVILLALKPRAALTHLLALVSLPLLLWYFAIAEHAMPRHLFIGFSLAVLCIVAFVASIGANLPRHLFSLGLVLLMIYTGDQASRQALASWPLRESGLFAAIRDIDRHLVALPAGAVSSVGMVDNNEFEYLAVRPNRFRSAYDQIADAVDLDEGAYLSAHPDIGRLMELRRTASARDYYVSPLNRRTEPVPVRFVRPLSFDWLHLKESVVNFHRPGTQNDPGMLCRNVVYQNRYYLIEHCETDDIKAFFDKAGGMPLRPRRWTPWILLPFERGEILY